MEFFLEFSLGIPDNLANIILGYIVQDRGFLLESLRPWTLTESESLCPSKVSRKPLIVIIGSNFRFFKLILGICVSLARLPTLGRLGTVAETP